MPSRQDCLGKTCTGLGTLGCDGYPLQCLNGGYERICTSTTDCNNNGFAGPCEPITPDANVMICKG